MQPAQSGGYSPPSDQYSSPLGDQYQPPPATDPLQPPPPSDPFQPLTPTSGYPNPAPTSGYPAPGPVPGYQAPGPTPGYPAPVPVPAYQAPGYPAPGPQMAPQWQPQPGAPGGVPPGMPPQQGGGSKSPLGWILGIVAGVVALCVIGTIVAVAKYGNDDQDDPGGRQTTGSSASPGTGGSGNPGGRGSYATLGDICPKIDLSPLGDWAKTKEAADTSQSKTGTIEHSGCDLRIRSAADVMATLDVSADVFQSPDDGKDRYAGYRDYYKTKNLDADLPGLGDEAFGTNEDTDMGRKVSDYTVRLRAGNMVLTVVLTTFGTSYVPKDQIKTKAVAETRSILTALSK